MLAGPASPDEAVSPRRTIMVLYRAGTSLPRLAALRRQRRAPDSELPRASPAATHGGRPDHRLHKPL